jgi:hypothetical protein
LVCCSGFPAARRAWESMRFAFRHRLFFGRGGGVGVGLLVVCTLVWMLCAVGVAPLAGVGQVLSFFRKNLAPPILGFAKGAASVAGG